MAKENIPSVKDYFFKKKTKNKDARKKVSIKWTADDGKTYSDVISISKVTLDQAAEYADLKADKGNLAYFADMFNNHVFDPETGDNYFKIEEILAKTPYISLPQFLNEAVDAAFVIAVQKAINEFTGVSDRKTVIEEIKN